MSVAREEEGTRPNGRIGGRPRRSRSLPQAPRVGARSRVSIGLGAEVLPAESVDNPPYSVSRHSTNVILAGGLSQGGVAGGRARLRRLPLSRRPGVSSDACTRFKEVAMPVKARAWRIGWRSPAPLTAPLSAGARRLPGERGADRFGAKRLERSEQAPDARERFAVFLAQPLGLVARLDEVCDGVAVGRQPRGAQHDRADPRPEGEVTQLLDERGELAQLEHVVDRQARGPEALARRDGDR